MYTSSRIISCTSRVRPHPARNIENCFLTVKNSTTLCEDDIATLKRPGAEQNIDWDRKTNTHIQGKMRPTST